MAEALRTADGSPAGEATGTGAAGTTADAPRLQTTVFAVENMHCGGCLAPVEDALLALPGVAAARANLTARRVVAQYDAGRVTPDQVIQALEDVGYRAAELADSGPATAGRAARTWRGGSASPASRP